QLELQRLDPPRGDVALAADRVSRRRGQRRDLGPQGWLQPDGRRRPGGLQTGRADFSDARAGRRLCLRRLVWGRALREDGAQRDRVFDAAELRRRIRDPQGRALWLRPRPAGPAVEPWQRDSLLVARAG